MMRSVVAILGAVLLSYGAWGQELTEQSYARLKKSLQLSTLESTWREIPWRPDLGTAILEARQAKKPILLWVMNGHPCGMT